MTPETRPLRILMTNNTLSLRAGSELYLRDLAISFMKRGHFPVAYSRTLGAVANELRAATIPVIDDLNEMAIAPDIIHGQHHLETMTAATHFPHVPVVYTCHGWVPWPELPPAFPNIMRYVAVDDLCRERLLTTHGIEPEQITTLYNFVDLKRFHRVRELPEKPGSALVFSNTRPEIPQAIRQACDRLGIDKVDIVGQASGNAVAHPEMILADYDIVFAKARSAIEAMASGCAVVVADKERLAGMVTPENLATFQGLNFGIRTLQQQAFTSDNVERELKLYNAAAAGRVTQAIRSSADMEAVADAWIGLYRNAIDRWRELGPAITDEARFAAISEYLAGALSPRIKAADQNIRDRKNAEAELARVSREAEKVPELEKKLRNERAEHEKELAAARSKSNQIKSSKLKFILGRLKL
ncbi:glycosyltransferase [Roseibium aggregatum]|uniref:Glycosyltransferase n=1 Tax=Roseibium aggregatum TaxID=187304 RepID=A0A926P4L5_9HYPH|nr:glycosyltransferase [Roseibium aggregatum]MBD1546887.1 glycosyltransferase [Roseibium aggregatum]